MAVNEHDPEEPSAEDVRIAALYRSAADEQPSERLDRVIREAARRPFEAPRPAPRAPWWHAWRVPVAFAGVAVLSVSVVMIAQRDGGEPVTMGVPPPDALRESAVPAEAASAPPVAADATSQGREATRPGRSPPRSEPPRATQDRAFAEGELAGSAQQRSGAAPSPGMERSAPEAGAAEPARTAPAPQRAPAPLQRLPPPPPAPETEAKPAPPPQPEGKAPPPPEAGPAPAPPAAKPVMRAPGEAAAGPAAPTLQIRGSAQESLSLPGLIAELDGRSPQQWIDRVVLLRTQGRREDADALLREFRRRYPEEPLPPGLQ
jgi:hypothetical protein